MVRQQRTSLKIICRQTDPLQFNFCTFFSILPDADCHTFLHLLTGKVIIIFQNESVPFIFTSATSIFQ